MIFFAVIKIQNYRKLTKKDIPDKIHTSNIMNIRNFIYIIILIRLIDDFLQRGEGMNDLIYRKTNIDESTIDKVPIWEKCTLTIDEAAEFSNIGKNKLSELLKRPRCPFVLYVGKKKLVKRKEFLEFISRNNEI